MAKLATGNNQLLRASIGDGSDQWDAAGFTGVGFTYDVSEPAGTAIIFTLTDPDPLHFNRSVIFGGGSVDGSLIGIFEVQGSDGDDNFASIATATGFTVVASDGDDAYSLGALDTLTYEYWLSAVRADLDAATGSVSKLLSDDLLVTEFGTLVLSGGDDLAIGYDSNIVGMVDGGAGWDELAFDGASTGVSIFLDSGTTSTGLSFRNFEAVAGGVGNDTVVATGANAINVYATAGDDNYAFAGGDDLDYCPLGVSLRVDLDAAGGTVDKGLLGLDRIAGIGALWLGAADDLVRAYDSNAADYVDAGGGIDALAFDGATSGVSIFLDSGTTSVGLDFANFEVIRGSSGDDTVFSGADHAITLLASAGNDNYDLGGGNTLNYYYLTAAMSVDLDSAGGSVNKGGSGTDSIAHVGLLMLGELNDSVRGYDANAADTVDGGAGNDTLSFGGATGGVSIFLSSGTTSTGLGFRNFEAVQGGQGNDVIVDTGNAQILLLASDGNDSYALNGNDTLSYAAIGTGMAVDLDTGVVAKGGSHGNDILVDRVGVLLLGSGNDTVTPSATTIYDSVDGGGGVNELFYRNFATPVTVNLAAGTATGFNHIAHFTQVFGGLGADSLTGSDGNDTLGGGQGNDLLQGGRGDDSMNGGQGDDSMFGGRGNDIFQTGAGNDSIDGGRGYDTAIIRDVRSNWLIDDHHDGNITLTSLVNGAVEQLHSVEFLQFDDGGVPIGLRAPVDFWGTNISSTFWFHKAAAGSDNELWIWRQVDGRTESWTEMTRIDSGWNVLGVGNIDGDTKADVWFQYDGTNNPGAAGQLYWWSMDGTTIADQGTGLFISLTDWTALKVADFSGDRILDFIWQQNDATKGLWGWVMDATGKDIANQGWLQDGAGNIMDNSAGWKLLGAHDINRDGTADLLWEQAPGLLVTWTMDGLTVTGTNSTALAFGNLLGVGDYFGTGNASLFYQDGNTVSVSTLDLTGNQISRVFISLAKDGTHADLTAQHLGDYDGDGRTDIIARDDIGQWYINLSGTSAWNWVGTTDATNYWQMFG